MAKFKFELEGDTSIPGDLEGLQRFFGTAPIRQVPGNSVTFDYSRTEQSVIPETPYTGVQDDRPDSQTFHYETNEAGDLVEVDELSEITVSLPIEGVEPGREIYLETKDGTAEPLTVKYYTPIEEPTPQADEELDSTGCPWSEEVHVGKGAKRMKTAANRWIKKKGVPDERRDAVEALLRVEIEGEPVPEAVELAGELDNIPVDEPEPTVGKGDSEPNPAFVDAEVSKELEREQNLANTKPQEEPEVKEREEMTLDEMLVYMSMRLESPEGYNTAYLDVCRLFQLLIAAKVKRNTLHPFIQSFKKTDGSPCLSLNDVQIAEYPRILDWAREQVSE